LGVSGSVTWPLPKMLPVLDWKADCGLEPKSPPLELGAGVGFPNSELPGVVDANELVNLEGAGVDVGVVDSTVSCLSNSDFCFAGADCSTDWTGVSASIWSSSCEDCTCGAVFLVSSRADPNPLPNIVEPVVLGPFCASSCAVVSGLKVLSNLKGCDPNTPPEGFSSVFLVPKIESSVLPVLKGLGEAWLPPPKMLPPVF
jgi:hypothetical protein